MNTEQACRRFRDLHDGDDIFVMPNPWDLGSARMLADLGYPALATTSSGFALSLGRSDGEVSLAELLEHVAMVAAGVEVPLSVDSERCFSETVEGVADTVAQLASAGAAGCSIEDWEPVSATIDPLDRAVQRVQAAVSAADDAGMVVTARAENHLRGVDDLDDTINRLIAYRDAGAHCLYAPGLVAAADIDRVVREVGAPINVLRLASTPSVGELGELGVRRISTGGRLARNAYDSIADTAATLLDYRPAEEATG